MTQGTSRRLRLGMVGGGPGAFIGGVHRIAARIDDCYDLVAGALSSFPEKSLLAGDQLRLVRTYGTYVEMAQAEAAHPQGIDVVAIVTPNHTHFAIAKAFLEAGIHVICDKPMTISAEDALCLERLVKKKNLLFGMTYSYTGYPMIRQAREMVQDGELGRIRHIQVEYAQDWLATAVESIGSKQAEWRTDPARSGPGGCLGDIATHAYQLAYFTSGLTPQEIAAEVTTFVPGRRVDDHVQAMIRFEGGVRATLWASQVAVGNENYLRLRIFGERGGLSWDHEHADSLLFSLMGEPTKRITRGGPGAGLYASAATRVPSGHPEGFLEAFAQLYTDMAEQITARMEDRAPHAGALLLPGVHDGVLGVKFIDAALRSSTNNAAWVSLSAG